MKKKLVIEIAEGLGNQLFMYAFAYSFSKQMNYDLLIDNKSGYSRKKNLLRNHQRYMLNNFNLIGNIADEKFVYNNKLKRLKKKLLLIIDKFSNKKRFLLENKFKINGSKIAEEFVDINKFKFSNNVYIQGNFENYGYFKNYKSELEKIFKPKNEAININNSLIDKLKNTNSVSIHVRRNRFSDQLNLKNGINLKKSEKFTLDIIDYINKSIHIINSKILNPEYFIWTNDFNDFNFYLDKLKIRNYTLIKNDIISDFNLFRYCKHFIVGPSSFHWWGAWLNSNKNKICLRPSNLSPSNNPNFWPSEWIEV